MNKKIRVAAVLIVGLGLAFYSIRGYSKNTDNLVLTGSVEGKSIEVVAQAPGVITGIYVKEGQHIEAGQLLAQLDDRDLQLKRTNLDLARQISELRYQDMKNGSSKALIRQAIAGRDQVKAQLDGSKKELDYLRKQLSDVKALVSSGAANTQQETDLERALEREQTRYNALSDQLRASQEGVNLTLEGAVTEQLKQAFLEIQIKTNEIQQMDLIIEKTKAVSPSAGYVQTANYELGEAVQTGQKLFSIIDPSDLQLKVFVSEKNLSLIKPGMSVKVVGDYASEQTLVGTVTFIAAEAEFTPKNIESKESKQEMVYEVHVKIEDKTGAIKPGMYLDADFGVTQNGR